jgi:hypothetical protein
MKGNKGANSFNFHALKNSLLNFSYPAAEAGNHAGALACIL